MKRENSDRKNSYFSELCSAAFTLIAFIILVIASQSISSQCLHYRKTGFFISRTLGLIESNIFQSKISTTKHGPNFFFNT